MSANKNTAQRYEASKQGGKTNPSKTEREFNARKGNGSKTKFNGRIIPKKTNDPQWYFKDTQTLNDVASFSFNPALGRRLNFNDYMPPTPNVQFNSQLSNTIAGVMSLHIGPGVGVALDASSPLNMAATNVYGYVRYKNSGSANYDSPDLMLYLIAMDSIYACWNWMKRIYGFASTYSQLNTYEPRAYMLANGVDFDNIVQNLAQLRAYLNLKTYEINAFCVPATMSFNVRHSWLFSNVYKDNESEKAQAYMYVPSYFYKYDETSLPIGGTLELVPVLADYDPNTSTLLTFNDLKNMLDGMLRAVNYSEDIGIMSGDILKAYEKSGLFMVSTFPEDYKVEPIYSKEVLTQIENAHPINVNWAADASSFVIVNNPNTNYLHHQPELSADNGTYDGVYLNFHWDSPTPENVIVGSRLCVTMSPTTNNTWKIESCGSELCTGGFMYQFAEDLIPTNTITVPSVPLKLIGISIWPSTNMVYQTWTPDQVYTYIYRMLMMSHFDWHPFVPISLRPTTSDLICTLGLFGDFDTYSFISNSNIEAMNTLALLTEFNVPN